MIWGGSFVCIFVFFVICFLLSVFDWFIGYGILEFIWYFFFLVIMFLESCILGKCFVYGNFVWWLILNFDGFFFDLFMCFVILLIFISCLLGKWFINGIFFCLVMWKVDCICWLFSLFVWFFFWLSSILFFVCLDVVFWMLFIWMLSILFLVFIFLWDCILYIDFFGKEIVWWWIVLYNGLDIFIFIIEVLDMEIVWLLFVLFFGFFIFV